MPNLVIKKLLDCYPIVQNAQNMVLELDGVLSNLGGILCLQEIC